MMISIAICTHNNAPKPASALESLRGPACLPSLENKILVINNKSSDQTKEAVAQRQDL